MLDRFDFVDRAAAVFGIHQPESMAEVAEARRRLVFDELLRVQLELVRRKRRIERETAGIAHEIAGELTDRFIERLPFPLTNAQQRAIGEIGADSNSPDPCIVFCRAMLVPARHWWRCTRSSRRCRVGIRVR